MFGPRFFKFPKIDMKSPSRSGGVNITIRSGTGMEPKIDVKTTGEYKKLEPDIKRKLGIRKGVSEVEEEPEKVKPRRKPPKITEEPETNIKRKGNKISIKIKLPDVKDSKDIEIRKLKQSLEVKAFAGDKAYFKLIPVNPNLQIYDRNFEDGILNIEIGG